MNECAKLIDINQGAMKLWEEAAIWSEGKYKRCISQIPKEYNAKYNEDGTIQKEDGKKFPIINSKDSQFQSSYNLTIYEMAVFDHQASLTLEKKLAQLLEKNEAVNNTVVTINNSAVLFKPVNKEKAIAEIKEGFPFDVLDMIIKESEDATQFQRIITNFNKYK